MVYFKKYDEFLLEYIQEYYTNSIVAKRILSYAGLNTFNKIKDKVILEPSMGVGNIFLEVVDIIFKNSADFKDDI